jgi:hypothetical protein
VLVKAFRGVLDNERVFLPREEKSARSYIPSCEHRLVGVVDLIPVVIDPLGNEVPRGIGQGAHVQLVVEIRGEQVVRDQIP